MASRTSGTVTRRKTAAPRARTKGAADSRIETRRHEQAGFKFTPTRSTQVRPKCAVCDQDEPELVYYLGSGYICAQHMIKAARMVREFWPDAA